jgi:hypothetical protein
MPYVWIAVALFIAISSGTAGYKIAKGACNAKEAAALQAAAEARKVDESFSRGVSAAYEGVAAQLRRLSAVNKTEVIRETQKVEYRCELPAAGERLRLDGIRAANAASGQPDKPVPADPGKPSEGLGRTANSVSGPGDDDGRVQR